MNPRRRVLAASVGKRDHMADSSRPQAGSIIDHGSARGPLKRRSDMPEERTARACCVAERPNEVALEAPPRVKPERSTLPACCLLSIFRWLETMRNLPWPSCCRRPENTHPVTRLFADLSSSQRRCVHAGHLLAAPVGGDGPSAG